MSAPPADRLVHDARIGPDDTPHEAASHVWAQVVTSHPVDPDDPLTRLGVFDRVVLVLQDVLGLSSSTVAGVLHSKVAAVESAHATARARIGLPTTGDGGCRGWQAVRVAHPPGDPAVLSDLIAHAAECPTCSSTVTEDQQHRHRWRRRAAGVATIGTAATGGSALGGTLAAAAAIVAAGVAAGALVGPLPEPPLPEPVVVDEDPDLPSDQEPVGGWPVDPVGIADDAIRDTSEGDDATAGGDAAQGATGQVDEPTGPIDDTVEDVGKTLDDTVDDVTDTVTETTDDVTDTIDDATGGTTSEALDDTVDDATDTIEETTDLLP